VVPLGCDPFYDQIESILAVSDCSLSQYLLNDDDLHVNEDEIYPSVSSSDFESMFVNNECLLSNLLSPPPSPPEDLNVALLSDDACQDYHCALADPLISVLWSVDSQVELVGAIETVAPSDECELVTLEDDYLIKPPPLVQEIIVVQGIVYDWESAICSSNVNDSVSSASLASAAASKPRARNKNVDVKKRKKQGLSVQASGTGRISSAERRANKQRSNRESAARYRNKMKLERDLMESEWQLAAQENARCRLALSEIAQEENTLLEILRDVEGLRRRHLQD